MQAFKSLFTDPMGIQAFLAGLSVVCMCGILSVLVVVKRLGFVGQGVSHSAFGGVGVASLLAVMMPIGLAATEAAQFAVIVAFCIAAALGMAAVSNRRSVPADTAIGMFLVGSMALGAILVHISREVAREGGRASVVQSWESILFGSIFLVGPDEAIVGWIISAAVLGVAWWVRRPLLFWVFDEESSPAFGVRAAAMKTTLMVLLAIAVVVAMRLAGVVLATALLVLPGATALRLTDRLWPALAFSVATGIVGLMAGLSLSLRFDWPPGPCVVLAMTVLFAIAAIGSSTYKTSSARAAPAGAPSP